MKKETGMEKNMSEMINDRESDICCVLYFYRKKRGRKTYEEKNCTCFNAGNVCYIDIRTVSDICNAAKGSRCLGRRN